MAKNRSHVPFYYEDELFFDAYEALYKVWKKRSSQRVVIGALNIGRESLKQWERDFVQHGTVGLLPNLPQISVDIKLERLVVLIKSCRPHECVSTNLLFEDSTD